MPAKGDILIERTSLDFIKAKLGQSILVETENNKRVELKVTGVVNDLTALPRPFPREPAVTLRSLHWKPWGSDPIWRTRV